MLKIKYFEEIYKKKMFKKNNEHPTFLANLYLFIYFLKKKKQMKINLSKRHYNIAMLFETYAFLTISFIITQIIIIEYIKTNKPKEILYLKIKSIFLNNVFLIYLYICYLLFMSSEVMFPLYQHYIYKTLLFLTIVLLTMNFLQFNNLSSTITAILIILIVNILFFRTELINQILIVEIVSYAILLIFLQKNIEKNQFKDSKMILFNIIINFFTSTILLIFYVNVLYRFGFSNLPDILCLFKENSYVEVFSVAIFIKVGIVPFFFYKFNFYKFLTYNWIFLYSIIYLNYFILNAYFIFLIDMQYAMVIITSIIIVFVAYSNKNYKLREFLFFSTFGFYIFLLLFFVNV